MDWENERYIRVYTRDTVEWEMLPWQSRALWFLLLRKVDRVGYLPLGKHGARGLAALVKLPPEVVEAGLEGLLEDGCVVRLEDGDGEMLFVPNFLPAQEARQSDRARKAKQRELEHARALARARGVTPDEDAAAPVTSGDSLGHGVTSRDIPSQNVTIRHESGQKVTTGHTASHRVTPSLAKPSLKKHTSNSAAAELDLTVSDGSPEGLEAPSRFGPRELVELWNERAHRVMPRVRDLTAKRKRQAAARLREHPEREWWEDVIAAANASPHCRGESKPAPGASKPWRCNFDFLIENDTNAVKVLEGVYGDDRVIEIAQVQTAGYRPFSEWD